MFYNSFIFCKQKLNGKKRMSTHTTTYVLFGLWVSLSLLYSFWSINIVRYAVNVADSFRPSVLVFIGVLCLILYTLLSCELYVVSGHLFERIWVSWSAKCYWLGVVCRACYHRSALYDWTNWDWLMHFIRSLHFCFTADLKCYSKSFCDVGSILSFAGLVYILEGFLAGLVHRGGLLSDVPDGGVRYSSMPFMGCFWKKWQLHIPLMLSLYVLIFLFLHCFTNLLLFAYFGLLDSITSQECGKLLCMPHFFPPSFSCPLLWMVGHYHLGPNMKTVFFELVCRLYRQWLPMSG